MSRYTFDRLFNVGSYYFKASDIVLVEKITEPELQVNIKLKHGWDLALTENEQILSFRDQYLEFFTKNGIKMWNEF